MRPAARRDAAIAAAFVAAALFFYGMILPAPVFLDDWSYVLDAPFLRVPWGVFWRLLISRDYFAFTAERTYQPLVTLFHYVCHVPVGFRLAGILLHAFNGLLLREVARRGGASETRASAAAALWLVFPFHSEAVFLSSFKGHLIAAASALGALAAWERAVESEGVDRRWLNVSRAALVLGFLGKETALVGLALIVLKILVDGRRRAERLKLLAGHAAIAAVYLVWRFGVLHPPAPLLFPALRRPLASFGWYLWSLVRPSPACLARTLPPGAWPGVLGLPYLALVFAVRRRKGLFFALLWIPTALLPFLHFIAFAHYSPVADRYLYLASAGACLALAELLAETRARAALAALALVWAGLLARRNGQFRDLPEVCEQTTRCAPDNPQAHDLLGEHYLTMGEFPKARDSFERAASLAADDPDIQNNLGLALFSTGDKEGARRAFEHALVVHPTAGEYNNLGLALDALGRPRDAIGAFDRALAMRPDWDKPARNKAEVLAKIRR